jgi:hypothetical protein
MFFVYVGVCKPVPRTRACVWGGGDELVSTSMDHPILSLTSDGNLEIKNACTLLR